MKMHRGMRPHDIPILMKIAVKQSESQIAVIFNDWLMKDLAHEMYISASEISESLNRSAIAELISRDKQTLLKENIYNFVVHGMRFVFPQKPGRLAKGIPTAFSNPSLINQFQPYTTIVWAHFDGPTEGESIEPLHRNLPRACLRDPELHNLVALCDTLRIGREKERKIAAAVLKNYFDRFLTFT